MKKTILSKIEIIDIVKLSESVTDCIVRLYTKVLPDPWENIISFNNSKV